MKHHITNLSITKPCTQSWPNMSPEATGRFCDKCQKTVIDFTGMPNNEILNVLSASSGVCGRFTQTQFNGLQLAVKTPPHFNFWKKLSIAAAVAGITSTFNARAKPIMPVTEQLQPQFKKLPLFADTSVANKKITGTVTDDTDRDGIPGVTIKIVGTNISTQTDANGKFILNVPARGNQVLQFNFIGYQTQQVKLNTIKKFNCEIKLHQSSHLLGEVVIVKRAPWYKRIAYSLTKPLRKLFRRSSKAALVIK